MPSFETFFDDDSIGSYLRNPFGEDFIKLEIDQKSFRTNKTKVSTAEYFPCDPLHYDYANTFKTFNHRCHPFIKTIIPSLEFITSLLTCTASLTSRP